MKQHDLVTKILAVLGTTLVGLPLLAPLVFGATRAIQSGQFLVDWLMPAELGFLVAAGAVLLLWAAFRAGSRKALVGWGIGVAVAAIGGVTLASSMTGLASGASAPEGWPFILVTSLFALYVAAVVELVVAGVLLCIDVFKHHGAVAPPMVPVA